MRLRNVSAGLAVASVLALTPLSALAQQPLKTAVDGTFAPHAMPKLEGGIQGFNVDLANEIGKRLKRPVDITATQFSGILPSLQAGTIDFVAAPVTVTKERAENYLFTEGYLNTDYQFLTKKGEPPITDLKQLKGKVIAVNKGAVYDSWARGLEAEIGWTIESFGTQTDAVQAVMAGRAYANVAGNTNIQYAVKQQPQLQLSYLHSTGLVWAAAFRKDSKELLGQVENAIECMKKDGTIAAMHETVVRHQAGCPALLPLRSFPARACRACPATTQRRARPNATERRPMSWWPSGRMAILTISGLRKSFGATEVLKGIDLSVNERELVFIIGPSGSGKSTLLRCINRLEEPSGGSVIFDGTEVTSPAADLNALRRSMGMVFQSFNLYPHMTALGNVTLALRKVLKKPREEADEMAAARLPRSASPTRRQAIRPSFPVASSSASPSPGRWRWAQDRAVRRADLGARSRAGRLRAGRHARPEGARHDHAGRQPRAALCPRGRRPHRLHGPRPDRRGGPAVGNLRRAARDRAPAPSSPS